MRYVLRAFVHEGLRLSILTLVIGLTSCATLKTGPSRVVQPGEKVVTVYTCRLEDNRLITSNEESVLAKRGEEESRLFWERKKYEPVELIAGRTPEREALSDAVPGTEDIPSLQLKGLHEVIHEKLAEEVVGKEVGRRFRVELHADPQHEVPETERKIQLLLARKVPKHLRIATDQFMSRTGSLVPPAVDQAVAMYPGLTGRVVSVTADVVDVEFTDPKEEPKKTAFGTRRVYDRGDHFLIRTDVDESHLVRTGPHLGRVSRVEGGMFEVDYSHPFGGQPLFCDVVPRSVIGDSAAVLTPRIAERGSQPIESKVLESEKTLEGSEPTPPMSTMEDSQDQPSGDTPLHDVDGTQESVAAGDLVEVHYTARLESGELVYTTQESTVDDSDTADWYRKPRMWGPEWITAGEQGRFPRLGNVLTGLRAGEKKTVLVPPEEAFGIANPALVKEYGTTTSQARTEEMSPAAWMEKFGTFPVQGKTYGYDRYLDASVTAISEDMVTVQFVPKSSVVQGPLGEVLIEVLNDQIELKLVPQIGARYVSKGTKGPITGRIVSAHGDKFTVDFNNPLAGKPLLLEVEVISLAKASSFEGVEIPWITDYDEGLLLAQEEEKPMVLVLYSATCSWSRKFLEETLTDPRVKLERDRFVWTKVESPDAGLKEIYNLTGYPLTVLLSPGGEVVSKINGYKDANSFRQVLKEVGSGGGDMHQASL